VGRLSYRISAQTGIQQSTTRQKRHNPAFYVRTMRRAVRAKQESEKLVLDDKYVGDSLKNQIDAHASACNPRTRRNFADRSGESTTSKTDGMDPRPLICGLATGQRCAEQHPNKRGGSEMEVTTIGIDLAKSAFVVSGADSSGRVVMRRHYGGRRYSASCVGCRGARWDGGKRWSAVLGAPAHRAGA
jgi:hypothetical protein